MNSHIWIQQNSVHEWMETRNASASCEFIKNKILSHILLLNSITRISNFKFLDFQKWIHIYEIREWIQNCYFEIMCEFICSWFHKVISYMNSFILWIHIFMISYVNSFRLWIQTITSIIYYIYIYIYMTSYIDMNSYKWIHKYEFI